MSKLSRNADPKEIVAHARTLFVTTKIAGGNNLLQSERNAMLLIDVLRSNVAAGHFRLHDFVIMPDHIHLLLSVDETTTIEKAVQYIKGGFSFGLKKELGYTGEVWHRGFADDRVRDRRSFLAHQRYIANNPVRRGLVDSAEKFPFTFAHQVKQKTAAAKAGVGEAAIGTTEVVPLHES